MCSYKEGVTILNISKEILSIQRLYSSGRISAEKAFREFERMLSEIAGFNSILFGKCQKDRVETFVCFDSISKPSSDLVYWNITQNLASNIVRAHIDALHRGEVVVSKETIQLDDADFVIDNFVLFPVFLDEGQEGFLLLLNTDTEALLRNEEVARLIADALGVVYLSEQQKGISNKEIGQTKKEELLDMLVEHSSDVIALFNVDWKPNYLSPSIERVFGFDRKQLMTPSFFEQFRSGAREFKKVVVNGVEKYRFSHHDVAGEKIWLESVFDTLYNSEGDIHGYFAIIRDISEELEGNKKMKETLEKEKALNEMKSQFISITSHEFKTPLSTIKSSVEICNIELERQLSKHPSEGKFRKHFNRVNSEVDRMNSLLVNLLNLEKINQGIIQVTVKDKKINSYLRAFLEDWVEHDTVVFESSLPDGFSYPLDVSLMNQVMTNLVENALKYGSRDRHVIVGASQDEGRLILTVKDFGDGIPVHEQEHLFKPFFRASNSNKYDKGSGLGLMITKKFIELQNGTVRFESEEGEGTCFYLTFPLA
ncbi:PAS domain-containing sensor histidine kinase [Echinicola strongylocentroti]|nr:PAS domain-containing sensor histidine kinase [Echinicola strongylocentroti]